MSPHGLLHLPPAKPQLAFAAALCPLLLAAPLCAWSQKRTPSIISLPPAKAVQSPTRYHPADTKKGQKVNTAPKGGCVSERDDGCTTNTGAGTGSKGSGTGPSTGDRQPPAGSHSYPAPFNDIWTNVLQDVNGFQNNSRQQPSTDDLLKNGPQVPKNASMSHLLVEGIIGPNWPVGLDFHLEGKGSVILKILTSENVQYQQQITTDIDGRVIAITRPRGLPDKLQPATFSVEPAAPAGSSDPAPVLRIFGLAAGPRAVGSIAIDQVSFGPASVQEKKPAQYGFHSHSDFNIVNADFMFSGVMNNCIVMKKDSETKLLPVHQDDHPQGTLTAKGTLGQHLLQIRASRDDGGDWVVAWSPGVVTLTRK